MAPSVAALKEEEHVKYISNRMTDGTNRISEGIIKAVYTAPARGSRKKQTESATEKSPIYFIQNINATKLSTRGRKLADIVEIVSSSSEESDNGGNSSSRSSPPPPAKKIKKSSK